MTANHTEQATALSVTELTVRYCTPSGSTVAVDGVSFSIARGEIVALVGESGSGKSTIGLSLLGLLPSTAVMSGRIELDSVAVTSLPDTNWRPIRGTKVALIPQDPGVSLNPTRRVGKQVTETLRIHGKGLRQTRPAAAVALLEAAGLQDPERNTNKFPHELSGGMRQRVLIASAMSGNPSLIIADEPTSALDVSVQKTILDNLQQLVRRQSTAVLLITHDLALAAQRADRVIVLRQGQIIEEGQAAEVLLRPTRRYTRALVESLPRLRALEREPLPRADRRILLEVRNLSKTYRPRSITRNPARNTVAVDDVSFSLNHGETLAVVGESGSGKSTLARLLLRLIRSDTGSVIFDGTSVFGLRGDTLTRYRRAAQLVYQNPYSSLNPRLNVAQLIGEPLRIVGDLSRAERAREVGSLLEKVALPTAIRQRTARELSGGQRQRVALARAIALKPSLLVLDEAVSALDVSVQAKVLDLLRELQTDSGLSYLFITHDLGVVAELADRVLVMRRGRIVEQGTTAQVLHTPAETYTRTLVDAMPVFGEKVP